MYNRLIDIMYDDIYNSLYNKIKLLITLRRACLSSRPIFVYASLNTNRTANFIYMYNFKKISVNI